FRTRFSGHGAGGFLVGATPPLQQRSGRIVNRRPDPVLSVSISCACAPGTVAQRIAAFLLRDIPACIGQSGGGIQMIGKKLEIVQNFRGISYSDNLRMSECTATFSLDHSGTPSVERTSHQRVQSVLVVKNVIY